MGGGLEPRIARSKVSVCRSGEMPSSTEKKTQLVCVCVCVCLCVCVCVCAESLPQLLAPGERGCLTPHMALGEIWVLIMASSCSLPRSVCDCVWEKVCAYVCVCVCACVCVCSSWDRLSWRQWRRTL